MNLGIIDKSVREIWFVTLVCGLGAFIFEALVTYLTWSYEDLMSDQIMEIPFVRNAMESLLGADMAGPFGPAALRVLVWVHPLILTIVWTHAVAVCTRMPAGELDRGTIDVLLGCPVSRKEVYLSETAVWLASGLIVIALAFLGNVVGHLPVPPEERPEILRSLTVAVNFYALYLAVGGLAFLASSMSDRRGRAVGVVVAILIVQVMWNFLMPYWEFARNYAYLTALDHYQPAAIIRDGGLPAVDLGVLILCAGVFWALGGLYFDRRDICTV